MLLCALREAKDTVPRKSALLRAGTGVLRSSWRCLLARPKSTMKTCLLSLERTKLDYREINDNKNLRLALIFTYSFNVPMDEAAAVDFFYGV
jgi:hypothetical protein